MSMLILSWQYKYLVSFWPNRKWKHKSFYVDIPEIPQRAFNGELIEKELHWSEQVWLKGRIFFLFLFFRIFCFLARFGGLAEKKVISALPQTKTLEEREQTISILANREFVSDEIRRNCLFCQKISKSFLVSTLILIDFSFLKLLSSQGHFLWASKQAQWKLRKCFWMKISMQYSNSKPCHNNNI